MISFNYLKVAVFIIAFAVVVIALSLCGMYCDVKYIRPWLNNIQSEQKLSPNTQDTVYDTVYEKHNLKDSVIISKVAFDIFKTYQDLYYKTKGTFDLYYVDTIEQSKDSINISFRVRLLGKKNPDTSSLVWKVKYGY